MEYRYDIDEAAGLILEQCWGPTRVEDLLAMVRVIWADPRYRPGYNGICDLHEAVLEFTKTELDRGLDELLADPRYSRGTWAVIVTNPLATAFAYLFKQGAAGAHPYHILNSAESLSLCPPFGPRAASIFENFRRARRG